MNTEARRLDLSLAGTAAVDDNKAALALPFNAGRAVTGIEWTASPQTKAIEHKLGRKPAGWIVTRVYSGGFSSLLEVSSDAAFLTLTHSGGATATVDLWVY